MMVSSVRRYGMLVCTLCVLLTGVLGAQSATQDSTVGESAEQKKLIVEALKLTSEASKLYQVKVGDADKLLAVRAVDPILRWSNPAAGEVHGHVFLWTVHERPVLIGSLFKWFSPHTHTSHEFHSLWEKSIEVSFEGRRIWSPNEGGIKFSPLDGVPAPAPTASQRLLQMRNLAKDFEARKTERNGSQEELRLLPKPIYRYAATEEKVVDGALFAFVQGTDPDLFLLLEAQGEGDTAGWHFAAARMNSVGFQLRHKSREVWKVDVMPWADISSHAASYTSFQFNAERFIGK